MLIKIKNNCSTAKYYRAGGGGGGGCKTNQILCQLSVYMQESIMNSAQRYVLNSCIFTFIAHTGYNSTVIYILLVFLC